MGNIHYRAIHTKSLWRKVNSHFTIENAIDGINGATGLFARQARIDFSKHGDPLYVLIWEDNAQIGYLIKENNSKNGIDKVEISINDIIRYEQNGEANPNELADYF